MSRPLRVGAGAIIVLLALMSASAYAAGTHSSTSRSSTDRPIASRVLLVPGTGYGLRSGSGQVRALQRQLDHDGFAAGPVDGLYGPLTTQAVRRFQQAHGLVVDGLAGHQTLTALDTYRATLVLRPGTGYGLRSGSRQVRVLQRELDRVGFASGPLDGLYGPLTTQAVRRFQQAHGLVVDGVAGPHTLGALHTQLVRARAARPVRRTRPYTAPTPGTHLTPRSRLVPLPQSPVVVRSLPVPALPTAPILLALALIGLLTGVRSYTTVRGRARHPRGMADPEARTR